MKTCTHCQNSNPDANRFCQQCGRPFGTAPARSAIDATVLMSGTIVQRGPVQQTHDVDRLFAAKTRAVIGRAPDCDLFLSHPTVSRYHALLEKRDDGLYLLDMGSANGVLIGRRRLDAPRRLQESDIVGIGPFLLALTGGTIRSLDNSRGLRLEVRELEKVVVTPEGGTRKLLDNVELVVNPGEFVTLLGPSGSGKSTLMDCLNGRRRATGGQVLANGQDFYRHFDNFRQSLGYVPQRDIVHDGLTVARALQYTARLRLPTDTDPEELQARVEAVVQEMDLGPHRNTQVANLSGGQIKRVSLGAELIAEPSMLYIDEATSGLDAGTEARMMRLFRKLADQDRSLICITHNVDNVDQCHLVLILVRGKLVYYGPPKEAPRYFGVARISDIYDRLVAQPPDEWEKKFHDSPLYHEYVLDRLALRPEPVIEEGLKTPPPDAGSGPQSLRSLHISSLAGDAARVMEGWPRLADSVRQVTAQALRLRERLRPITESWRQFRVLTARYVELIVRDTRSLRLLLLQAPIVALFLLCGFLGKPYDEKLPMLRELEPDERKMLVAVNALDQLVHEKRPLDEKQKGALGKVRFRAQTLAGPAEMDGTQLLALLRHVRDNPPKGEQRRALEQANFEVDVDGKPITVTGAEMLRAREKLRESKLLSSLLELSGPVVPMEQQMLNPRFTYVIIFLVVIIVLWFGCNNASKEIVKEEAIYSRERAVNLRILPYLASKFLVLGALTVLHVFLLMLVLYGTIEAAAAFQPGEYTTPPSLYMLDYARQFGMLALLALTGVALGLLLSACVSSPDRANTLLPYVLIPQMILGGGILTVDGGPLYYLAMMLSPAYWAYRGIHLGSNDLPPHFPGHTPYPDGLALPALALTAQMVVLLMLTAGAVKRKDA